MVLDIQIRPVQQGDEDHVAQVHIQSWQEAYRGLLPQSYLDNLKSELSERKQMWSFIVKHPKRWAYVATAADRIIGFVLFGPARDPGRGDGVELGAIYLLEEFKNQGVGYSLLKTAFQKMKELGFDKTYCWVLEGNPTINFYEKSGAKYSGLKKQDQIGNETFNELAYEWSSLDLK